MGSMSLAFVVFCFDFGFFFLGWAFVWVCLFVCNRFCDFLVVFVLFFKSGKMR